MRIWHNLKLELESTDIRNTEAVSVVVRILDHVIALHLVFAFFYITVNLS